MILALFPACLFWVTCVFQEFNVFIRWTESAVYKVLNSHNACKQSNIVVDLKF